MERTVAVLKKISPNGEMKVYLRCRDFASSDEPIDGGVTVSAEYLQGRKVFGRLIALYRFGREEDEIMGLKFSREFVLASQQIYPPTGRGRELTDTQIAIRKKVGYNNEQVHPFTFYFPETAPASVSLFSKDKVDVEKACGIHYYLSIFIGHSEEDESHKRNSVKLNVRRVQSVSEIDQVAGPQALIRKGFLACSGSVEVEAILDKLIFATNEKISVNIGVQNYSHKKIKKMRVTLFQNVSVQMLQKCHYRRIIDETVTRKVCPIQPGASTHTVVTLRTSVPRNRIEEATVLDGNHRSAESELASSTYLHHYPVKGAFGIIVNYSIRIKLYAGSLKTPIVAELPVVIMPCRNEMVSTETEQYARPYFKARADVYTPYIYSQLKVQSSIGALDRVKRTFQVCVFLSQDPDQEMSEVVSQPELPAV